MPLFIQTNLKKTSFESLKHKILDEFLNLCSNKPNHTRNIQHTGHHNTITNATFLEFLVEKHIHTPTNLKTFNELPLQSTTTTPQPITSKTQQQKIHSNFFNHSLKRWGNERYTPPLNSSKQAEDALQY